MFVIAFPDPAVRQSILQRLTPLGIRPRFFDAVIGSKLSGEQRQPFKSSGRELQFKGPLVDGAMGCSLSHFGIWQTMIDEGIEAALVLEDDAIAALPQPSGIAERLNTLYLLRGSLDLVFLHRRWDRSFVRVDGSHENQPGLTMPRYSDLGTESYFITNRCAKYFLSQPERYRLEVDKFMHHWWNHDPDIHVLINWPALFREEGRSSQIGREGGPVYKRNPLHHILMRRFHRVRGSLLKRLFFKSRVARVRERMASAKTARLHQGGSGNR